MRKLSLQLMFFMTISWFFTPVVLAIDEQESVKPLLVTDSIIKLESIPKFKEVGKVQITWFWFEIYQATLKTPSGVYKPNKWPLLLELNYQKDVTAEQLITSTVEDWERQKINYDELWIIKLDEIWPDVATEDQLTLYVDKASISHFFYNSKFIGSVNDPLFSSAFTAIWLSENTIKPAQRNQLIGITP
jgi:hypothetical protein